MEECTYYKINQTDRAVLIKSNDDFLELIRDNHLNAT